MMVTEGLMLDTFFDRADTSDDREERTVEAFFPMAEILEDWAFRALLTEPPREAIKAPWLASWAFVVPERADRADPVAWAF